MKFYYRSLCAMAIICGAYSWIPYNDIQFQLLDGFPGAVDSQVQQLVQTTKNFFLRNDVNCVTEAGSTRVINYSPYLRQIVNILPIVQGAIGNEHEWKHTLHRVIPDSGRRIPVENAIRSLETTLRNIGYHIGNLDPHRNLTADGKAAVVENIHDALDSMVGKFAQRSSIFRKFPIIAMPMVLALASLISLFIPVETALYPHMERRSLISCRLFETLVEYRPAAAESRLLKLEIIDSSGATINRRNPIHNVMSKPYNEYGYNQSSDASVSCRRECRATDGDHIFVCLKDPMSGTEYDCNKRYEMYNCLFSYMEFIRHQVERSFVDPIKLLLKGCSIEARNQPRFTKTGYGWWEIMFLDAAAIEDSSGSNCDDWDDCDAYIKVFIDGREVFRTNTRTNNHLPYFGETYRSPKMLKQARIRIEMWDEDSGWMGSTDDLILRWDTNIDELLLNGIFWSGRGNVWRNRIVSTSTWKDEYPDWELQQFLANREGFREVVPTYLYIDEKKQNEDF